MIFFMVFTFNKSNIRNNKLILIYLKLNKNITFYNNGKFNSKKNFIWFQKKFICIGKF